MRAHHDLWSPLRRGLVIGAAAWVVAVIVAFKVDDRSVYTMLFPLLKPVGTLGGPGAPLPGGGYEATPVQLFLGLAGIALSALPYMAVAVVVAVVVSWVWSLLTNLWR